MVTHIFVKYVYFDPSVHSTYLFRYSLKIGCGRKHDGKLRVMDDLNLLSSRIVRFFIPSHRFESVREQCTEESVWT
jgi:hypothetical protein